MSLNSKISKCNFKSIFFLLFSVILQQAFLYAFEIMYSCSRKTCSFFCSKLIAYFVIHVWLKDLKVTKSTLFDHNTVKLLNLNRFEVHCHCKATSWGIFNLYSFKINYF